MYRSCHGIGFAHRMDVWAHADVYTRILHFSIDVTLSNATATVNRTDANYIWDHRKAEEEGSVYGTCVCCLFCSYMFDQEATTVNWERTQGHRRAHTRSARMMDVARGALQQKCNQSGQINEIEKKRIIETNRVEKPSDKHHLY